MRGEKTQHFQKKALDNMSNYLENYYGKAFGKEMRRDFIRKNTKK